MKFDRSCAETLLELMEWRRDIRHFSTQVVSDEHLATLKRAMVLAPSVGNSQPWRVVSVQSAALREEIISNHQSANASAARRYDQERRQKYFSLKLGALEEAPVQLAVFTETEVTAGHGLGRQSMPETLSYSTVIAIHGLWLAARSLNLGVGWVSIIDPQAIERALDVPNTWKLTAYLCIGHPLFDDDTPELERVGWQKSSQRPWLVK